MLGLGVVVGSIGDEPLLHHAFDDLLDELFELLACRLLIAVRRLAQQLLQRLVREHAAAEQRLENGVVQRLHRPILVAVARIAPRVAEAASQEQLRQLRDEILEIDLVEQVACVLCVAELHRTKADLRVGLCLPTTEADLKVGLYLPTTDYRLPTTDYR